MHIKHRHFIIVLYLHSRTPRVQRIMWLCVCWIRTYLLSDATAHEAALSAGSHLSDIVQVTHSTILYELQ